jgi:hypothetical protein
MAVGKRLRETPGMEWLICRPEPRRSELLEIEIISLNFVSKSFIETVIL